MNNITVNIKSFEYTNPSELRQNTPNFYFMGSLFIHNPDNQWGPYDMYEPVDGGFVNATFRKVMSDRTVTEVRETIEELARLDLQLNPPLDGEEYGMKEVLSELHLVEIL